MLVAFGINSDISDIELLLTFGIKTVSNEFETEVVIPSSFWAIDKTEIWLNDRSEDAIIVIKLVLDFCRKVPKKLLKPNLLISTKWGELISKDWFLFSVFVYK